MIHTSMQLPGTHNPHLLSLDPFPSCPFYLQVSHDPIHIPSLKPIPCLLAPTLSGILRPAPHPTPQSHPGRPSRDFEDSDWRSGGANDGTPGIQGEAR